MNVMTELLHRFDVGTIYQNIAFYTLISFCGYVIFTLFENDQKQRRFRNID
jgi:hypothetical protein